MRPAPVKTLLVIDDDRLFCDSVKHFFEPRDIQVRFAQDKARGEHIFSEDKIDVILLDQKLPDGLGVDLCGPILSANDQTKIIFITAYPSFENAINAIRHGAFDYLLKPVELEELEMVVDRAFRTQELEQVEQIQNFKNKQDNRQTILIGENSGLREVSRLINLSAESDAGVLITGETGTGKNVVAKSIHYRLKQKSTGFVGINCAALPENLIESELFGHEKGAFTGALSTQKGIFEMAKGGTLFLDEIGDLPLHLQSKLLGVLDEKKLKRIGSQSFQKINARIIAATNINLEQAVQEKKFREDLYYRLSVLRIHLPPLRDRKQDIPALCAYFVRKTAKHSNIELDRQEVEKLQDYHWPGNVRELKNIIERSIILKKNSHIHPSLLIGEFNRGNCKNAFARSPGEENSATLAQVEADHIHHILEKTDHNHTRAAKILGISRSTLIRKLKK